MFQGGTRLGLAVIDRRGHGAVEVMAVHVFALSPEACRLVGAVANEDVPREQPRMLTTFLRLHVTRYSIPYRRRETRR